MTCADMSRLILARVDGRLDADQRRLLDEHLQSCDGCRSEAASQAAVAAVLASRPALEVSARFADRVIGRIATPLGVFDMADWRKWTWRLSPIAAALVLAALLIPVRQASTPATSEISLASEMEAWAAGGSRTSVPVTALFWQQNVSNDSLLAAVLTASPDATIERDSRER
jgi:anti-sigma factor RsiW